MDIDKYGGIIMAYSELVEEAKTLTERNMAEVTDFIKFLKAKQNNDKKDQRRCPDLLKGRLKFMADDFDETPDCFGGYI